MKLASIETIYELNPHPNADRLEVAKVLGWQSVVKKDEFKAGDNIVFVVIDTILPRTDWSEFLVDQKRPEKPIRLRTVKLRGQYSQGLCLPLSVLPEHMRDWQIGADVGGTLGLKKYEKEIPACLAGISKGRFPEHIAPRTDEDNGLSYPDIVAETLRYPCIATLKLDGSSCTVIVRDGQIVDVCSRNLSLVEDDKNAFWKSARKIKLAGLPLVPLGETLVVQGELMGPGIQGNQLKLTEPTLYVFQMRTDIGWMDYYLMSGYAAGSDLNVVPLVSDDIFDANIESLQALADTVTLPDWSPAEGIVVRPQSPVAAGNGRPLGFKVLNRQYKD